MFSDVRLGLALGAGPAGRGSRVAAGLGARARSNLGGGDRLAPRALPREVRVVLIVDHQVGVVVGVELIDELDEALADVHAV